jgi:fucose permease
MLAYLLLFGPLVLVPALVQDHGAGALRAGLVTAALPLGFALAATGADRLVPSHWAQQWRLRLGLLVAAAGLAGLFGTVADPRGDPVTVVALLVAGLGLGVYTPANNAAIMTAVPEHSAAAAGGLVSAARAVGTGVGVAVVTATLSGRADGALSVAVLLGVVAVAAVTC